MIQYLPAQIINPLGRRRLLIPVEVRPHVGVSLAVGFGAKAKPVTGETYYGSEVKADYPSCKYFEPKVT